MANDIPITGMTPSALWRLQQILIAQEEAAAEQRRTEVRKLELANDPLERAKQQAAVEMLHNRRDVRPMSLPEEGDFLGAGAPLGGGVEAMRPRPGVPLGPIVKPPAGQGGIERGITAPRFDESQSLGTIVPRVRGGKPRITEGQSASPRRSTGGPRATPLLPRASGENFTSEFSDQVPRMLAATQSDTDQPRLGPTVRSRTAFTDRDTPMTEQRMDAERKGDRNYKASYAFRRDEARLHPSVLAAEAYASGRTGRSGSAADAAEQQFIDTNLPVLVRLGTQLNQIGGTAGRVIGGIRKYVTGPLAINDDAREFNRIREPLSLVLASRFNGGRPTEPDREAAAQVLMDLGDSPELTSHLTERIYAALADPSIRTITNPATGQVYTIRSGGAAAGPSPENGAETPRPGTRRQINGQWAIWDGRGWAPE